MGSTIFHIALIVCSQVYFLCVKSDVAPPRVNPAPNENSAKYGGGVPQTQQAYMEHPQQMGQRHMPSGPNGSRTVLHTKNIRQEKDHIAEHIEVPLDTSKMNEEELKFHYFKMHDNDSNNKLDGCELIKSLFHWHEEGHGHAGASPGTQTEVPKLFSDEELLQLIDPILIADDINQDGYIDYTEFIRAQEKISVNPF